MSNKNLQTTGMIFNIQRYSIHDGPGIRTIVFLKGCPLRCKWCCNPESQSRQIQTMIRNGKEETVGKIVTVAEVLEEVKKDAPYYQRSGGGVTLSGGETFVQPDFARAILEECSLLGIDTAVETAASLPFSYIEPSLPYLNHVLMDIKHMNSQKHQAFTGMPNSRMLENAKNIAKHHSDLTIRIPVIPNFNDTEDEISDIATYAASLPGVKKLHLLPYHRLGEDKYSALGREYSLSGILPPEDEKMQQLLEVAKKSGLCCQIGG